MLAVVDVKGFLLETSTVTAASTVILSAVGWILTPRIRSFIWATLANDTTQYDKLRVESFGRQIAAGKEVVRTMLSKELAQLEAIHSVVEDHANQIEFVHKTVLRQADEIKQLPIIAQSLQSIANSSKETARAMREIHNEVSDHGKRLERWDGYFDGQRDIAAIDVTRRHRKRRLDDPEPDDV